VPDCSGTSGFITAFTTAEFLPENAKIGKVQFVVPDRLFKLKTYTLRAQLLI
jgi:hypothetical protein